jgi:hypothetical protein
MKNRSGVTGWPEVDHIRKVLRFGKEGKLESICLAGFPNFLVEYPHLVDMQGKFFRPAGWDECFPTIEAYQGYAVMGDLIGLEPVYEFQQDRAEQTWSTPAWSAERIFRLTGSTRLEIQFTALNRGAKPAEFLWASHALFTIQGLQSINLPNATQIADFKQTGHESKTFHPNTQPIRVDYGSFQVELTSDQPYWGIWLNLGGWPQDAVQPLYCVGIEATNSPAEIPGQKFLSPGETFTGAITVQMTN